MRLLKAFIFLFYVTSSAASLAANISLRNDGDNCIGSSPTITGTIERGDLIKFKSLLSSLKKKYGEKACSDGNTFVHINSEGGDVEEALLIGREIRKSSLGVIVHQYSSCLSSCVFILAGGVNRLAFGKIGIHRPYFSAVQSGKSSDDIRAMRNQVNKQIKSYLSYVDVPENLLDEMLAIPPEKIKMLSEVELIKFRLHGKDATQDEIDVAKQASYYNLASSEYRKRQSESIARCMHFFEIKYGSGLVRSGLFRMCNDAIILRISENESKRRHDKADAICSGLASIDDKINCTKRIVVDNN
jgi:hypothetical protein